MFRWLPYPFLRFIPFLMLGIGSASSINLEVAFGLFLAFFIGYSYLVYLLPKPVFSRHHPWGATFVAISFILLGIIRTQQFDASSDPNHLLHFTDSADYYIATVADYPESKKNSFRINLNLESLVNPKKNDVDCSAKIIAYQPKSDSCNLLQFGDRILVKGLPDTVESPKNPSEFNYQQYLAFQGIYHQQFLPSDRWVRIDSETVPAWLGLASRWRNQCREILLKYVNNEAAQGIALAISLGSKNQLDSELQSAYAAAGAMHVLAVSGLHVGIIYLIVSFLLKPFQGKSKVGIWLNALLCCSILWFYAALTGFSPSVQRAALMFTFVIIADASRRQSSIYNTLALSALTLLWINPYLMYSVGFQLSYLAVFGIVYLQPRIASWLQPNNKLGDWAWQLTAVSLAAQIATFPLGLYYFHQFPVYFWLSNLIVIPGALVMLPLGLATVLAGFTIPRLAEWIGWLLEEFILLVNKVVIGIQTLPYSTIDRISITVSQTWLLYLFIILVLLFIYYRKLHYLLLAVSASCAIMVVQLFQDYHQSQENSITVYDVKDETHLDFTQGFSNAHWGSWKESADYHILPNHIKKGVQTEFLGDSTLNNIAIHRSEDGITLIQYQNQLVGLVKKPIARKNLKQPIDVDYVIVANNAIRQLDDLDNVLRFRQLIIDGTNSHYTARRLAEQANQKHIVYHSVPLEGALTINCEL